MESVEVVQRFRNAVFTRDFEAAAALLAPDLIFYAPKPGVVLRRNDLLAAWAEPPKERDHLATENELGPAELLPVAAP